jgi:photosystem II stability/assembly factor-like uncharacterized protein
MFFYCNCFSQWHPANSGLEELFNPFLSVYNLIGLNGNLYALYGGKGTILFSNTYGESWTLIDLHKDNFYPNWCDNCLESSGDTLYIGNTRPTPSNIIFRSWDNFKTWDYIDFPVYIDISAMTIKINNIYIGTRGYGWIAKSQDFGKTWYVKDDKLYPYNENADIIDINVFGSRIFVSLNNPNHPDYNGIYYTDDEMESFKMAEINSVNRNSIRFSRHNEVLYAFADNEAYKSLDSGITWNSLKQSFGEFTPNTLEFAFKDSIQIVGGFKEAKIIVSTDNGKTWTKKDEGLDWGARCLTIYGDYVFAGTSNGIYRIRLDELTDVKDKPNTKEFIRILSNPFSNKTKISINIEYPSYAKITVYNSLGYVIDVLAEGYLSDGTHEFTFDGSALASGTYYYVLQADGKVETGKLVLIK